MIIKRANYYFCILLSTRKAFWSKQYLTEFFTFGQFKVPLGDCNCCVQGEREHLSCLTTIYDFDLKINSVDLIVQNKIQLILFRFKYLQSNIDCYISILFKLAVEGNLMNNYFTFQCVLCYKNYFFLLNICYQFVIYQGAVMLVYFQVQSALWLTVKAF